MPVISFPAATTFLIQGRSAQGPNVRIYENVSASIANDTDEAILGFLKDDYEEHTAEIYYAADGGSLEQVVFLAKSGTEIHTYDEVGDQAWHDELYALLLENQLPTRVSVRIQQQAPIARMEA